MTQGETDAADAVLGDAVAWPWPWVASGYNGMPSNCPNDELPWGKKSSSGHGYDTGDSDTTQMR